MDRNFTIRLFEEKDLRDVVNINRVCLPENYDESFFLEIYHHFPRTFLVATVDSKIGGYLMCRVETGFSETRSFRITRKGHVVSIAVLPEYRRRGIANALLTDALKSLSEYSIGECYLEVRISNKPAIQLYKNLGFSNSRQIVAYYRDGEDAYLMVKPMGSS